MSGTVEELSCQELVELVTDYLEGALPASGRASKCTSVSARAAAPTSSRFDDDRAHRPADSRRARSHRGGSPAGRLPRLEDVAVPRRRYPPRRSCSHSPCRRSPEARPGVGDGARRCLSRAERLPRRLRKPDLRRRRLHGRRTELAAGRRLLAGQGHVAAGSWTCRCRPRDGRRVPRPRLRRRRRLDRTGRGDNALLVAAGRRLDTIDADARQRAAGGAVVIKGKLYVVGGVSSATIHSANGLATRMQVYDIARRRWGWAPGPTPREHLGRRR